MKPLYETWNLKPFFDGDDDPRIAEDQRNAAERSRAFVGRWRERQDWLEDPKVLREALDDYEEWARTCGAAGNAGFYFHLRSSQDENDPALKAKTRTVDENSIKIANEMQFFGLRLAKVSAEAQQRFLAAPELEKYRHYLDRLFAEAKYLLSDAEERILNLKSGPAHSNWVDMTSGFLSREEREVLREDGTRAKQTLEDLQSLLQSKQKAVRDEAGAAVNDILAAHVDVAEAEMNSILADKKTDDELRGVERPDLGRHLADDIDSATVDALVAAVAGRFDLSQKFYALKAKLLGVPKLAYHERGVAYGNIDKKYSFEESLDLAHKVFAQLDPEFGAILERFVRDGQLDIYPRKGKRGGAFCAENLLTQPTYVLLNHTDRLRDVLTLAHEMGHAVNAELMRVQHALYFGTSLATAEVASTFMEDFITQEILKGVDDETRLALLVMKLGDEVSTIFRQVACYRFETDLHREFRAKGYLSKEEIGALFQKNMAAYMGDAVEQSAGSENWWVYWSHIRTFFYVYSYASGLLISKSLQAGVKADPAFIGKVKEFLSAGASDSPHGIFLKTGIDINDAAFWNKGLAECEALLNEAAALAKKLGKI